jgi:hypothetical protein
VFLFLVPLAILLVGGWIRTGLAVGVALHIVTIAMHLGLALLLLAFLPNGPAVGSISSRAPSWPPPA